MNDLTVAQQVAVNEQALQDTFTNALTKILDFTPFSEDWVFEDDGEKHLFAIIHHPLAIAEVCKSQAEDGRRIIMVGTPVGTVAVCEKFPLGHGPFALDIVSPLSLDFILDAATGDLVDVAKFTRVVNPRDPSENIGRRLATLERVMGVHRRVKTRAVEKSEEMELLGHAHRNVAGNIQSPGYLG